jgi:hypothetical protein
MVRIPGSHNGKCVQRNNGIMNELSEVKIIQKWDGVRPKIKMLDDFYIYLADQKIKELQEIQRRKEREKKYHPTNSKVSMISWIERLLQTPNFRKYCIWGILAPYLVNFRKLTKEQSFTIIREWLDKCATLRILDSVINHQLKYNIRNAKRTGYLPISLSKLRDNHNELYQVVIDLME